MEDDRLKDNDCNYLYLGCHSYHILNLISDPCIKVE